MGQMSKTGSDNGVDAATGAGEITLGPVLFNWPVETWQDFYFKIADESAVERVYVGEVICSKRAPLFYDAMDKIIDRLQRAGKQVILSSLAEVSNGLDRHIVNRIAGENDFGLQVEANDVSALWHLGRKSHSIGPYMNVYNEHSLRHFAAKGATSICLPPEMPHSGIQALGPIAEQVGIELEVQVYGRLPLALSARCYHARAHDLTKDTCEFVCDQDADGMVLDTLDGDPVLAINGIQTMSYTCLNLVAQLGELRALGISYFRVSPHARGTLQVIEIFDAVLKQTMAAEEATAQLKQVGLDAPFSDGFYHNRPGVTWNMGGSGPDLSAKQEAP